MSFYTGKDNSNNAILHITKGVTPEVSNTGGGIIKSYNGNMRIDLVNGSLYIN